MYRMNFVFCATNHSQESANSPHSFCPFIRVNMVEEELTMCVVDNDSGMCKTDFAGDGAPPTVLLSTVDRSTMPGIIVEMDQKDSYVEDEAQSKRR